MQMVIGTTTSSHCRSARNRCERCSALRTSLTAASVGSHDCASLPDWEASMTNRRTHRRVGCIAGAVYAANQAKSQTVGQCITENVGGAMGNQPRRVTRPWALFVSAIIGSVLTGLSASPLRVRRFAFVNIVTLVRSANALKDGPLLALQLTGCPLGDSALYFFLHVQVSHKLTPIRLLAARQFFWFTSQQSRAMVRLPGGYPRRLLFCH